MASIEYQVEEGARLWPGADPALIRGIAAKATALAEETERQGNEEDWAFSACQSSYGCDWQWQEHEDEPTARVYDCDGNTIDTITD